jgi:geranylgeranyl pyrophosphate synthase
MDGGQAPGGMSDPAADVVTGLGFAPEIGVLREHIARWIARADGEVRAALEWQFQGTSKYFRPLTAFSCYRAVYEGPVPSRLIRSAAVLEMLHNVSLVVDDILDASRYRRGLLTLHARFGMLPALMVSGYIVADAYRIVQDDPHDIRLFSELLKRLGVAECLQWRLRRQPLGVDDWRRIAGEDTGSMFEVCACLGTRTEELRSFGRLLGLLYHGCDDVGDLRGARALGGGGDEDLRDGILTLPAALAIRDTRVAALFCQPDPPAGDLQAMATAFQAQLPDAESYLDTLAEEARREACRSALNPGPLLALVHHTRQLSSR